MKNNKEATVVQILDKAEKEEMGRRLRIAREASGVSVQDASERLAVMGYEINKQTIYGYENGVSRPNASVLMAFCDIYGITNAAEYFRASETPILTEYQKLVRAYKNATDHERSIIWSVLHPYIDDSIDA